MSWIDELRHELAAAQIPPRRRRRIILELEDHLSCDPTAVERLGEPRELASRFADEIGTTRSLRAAFAVFLALAPFGLLFGALAGLVGPAHLRGSDENLIGPAVILGTQLAFVGGTLALVRAWRLRRAKSVPAAQAAILRRRAGLGLAGGLLTLAGIAIGTPRLPAHVAPWYAPLAYATVGVGAVGLAAAGLALASAARLRPVGPGPPSGDLESDLGSLVPGRLRGEPWRLAIAIAGIVALCIAAAGLAQGDPFDGLARALLDASACLVGFAALARPLGMRA